MSYDKFINPLIVVEKFKKKPRSITSRAHRDITEKPEKVSYQIVEDNPALM